MNSLNRIINAIVGALLIVVGALSVWLAREVTPALRISPALTTAAASPLPYPSEAVVIEEQTTSVTAQATATPTPIVSVPTANNIYYARAAAQNDVYKTSLTWTFGGKQQRGWQLYEPLLREFLNLSDTTDNSDFVVALATWQGSVGMPPTGVLDDKTLFEIVKIWQTRRLKQRERPLPDQLLLAPSNEFWDPARAPELRYVERNTYNAYKQMVRAAAADKSLQLQTGRDGELLPSEQRLKIVSAYRSPEYQARLRAQSPGSGRAGLAVNSPHFTGRALDLYVGGLPVETIDSNRAIQVNTPVYRWLVKNAGRFGFKPYFYEPWHWEYAPDETITR